MKHLWIIENRSSTNLLYHSYTKMDIDPNLVSGLLIALNNFSEVELKGTGISSIDMGHLRWVYLNNSEKTGLLLVAAGDPDSNAEVTRSRLDVIHQLFTEKYEITKESLQKGLINVDKFLTFNEELSKLEEQWNQAELILGAATMFDMLGVFQQLYNNLFDLVRKNLQTYKTELILGKIGKLAEELKTSPEFMQIPGFSDLEFDREEGWSILSINPMFMDEDSLKDALFLIAKKITGILTYFIKPEEIAYYFNKDVFPYLIQEMPLLIRLHLVKDILELFSTVQNGETYNNSN